MKLCSVLTAVTSSVSWGVFLTCVSEHEVTQFPRCCCKCAAVVKISAAAWSEKKKTVKHGFQRSNNSTEVLN